MKSTGLLKLIKVEFNKLKGTKSLPIFMFFPFFFFICGLMNVMKYKHIMLKNDPWGHIYEQNAIAYGGIFFPIVTAIIIISLTKIEFKHNNFKKIFSLPVTRGKIYFAKFITCCLLTLTNVLIFIGFCILSAIIIIHTKQIPMYVVFSPLLAFVFSLPIMAIQYYLSIRFKNIVLPLGLAIILIIPTMIINATKFWFVFPFTYPSHVIMFGTNFYTKDIPYSMILIGITTFLIFINLGANYLNKIDIR
ncbi:MAG: ABC transporter permease [Marinisporobacter sp.]|jgi:hypothetical protein|nr:ABC transporter permease [Marinisporobacter sp.]